MSRVFYDRFIVFGEVEQEMDNLELDTEERHELERLIDELVHFRVVDRILRQLPRHFHAEFLDKFHKAPWDEELLAYLDERVEESVEKHVKEEVEKLKKEILEDLKPRSHKKN